MSHTADGDGRAEGDLLRLIVEVVNVPVQAHHAHRLQREVLLGPHLQPKGSSSALHKVACAVAALMYKADLRLTMLSADVEGACSGQVCT